MAQNTKVAICSLLIASGIFTIAYLVNKERPSHESTEISDGENYYDFNKSTDTVNRSSDIRYNRTMDTRPRDYDETFGEKAPSIPDKVNNRSVQDNRVYLNHS